MSKYVFIADYFVDEILGGGELNNEELINILRINNEVISIKSKLVTESFIRDHQNSNFIIANFMELKLSCRDLLQDKKYIIYEHDHKYLKTRNPASYPDYLAPEDQIINYDFYKNANMILCQSNFHKSILQKNLKLDNVTSLSGNLWSEEALDKLEVLSYAEKKDEASILDSNIPHKNTIDAIKFCNIKEIKYNRVKTKSYTEFLQLLGSNKTLVFFPKTPETLSRVVVEARMMGMSVTTNKTVGATRENWFELKGLPLINVMREKRTTILDTVENVFHEQSF